MKVSRRIAFALTLLALSAMAATVSWTARASDGPAIVIHNDGLCGMPGSDADGNIIFGGIGIVRQVVENGNKVSLTCKGEDIANLSNRGQNFSEFGCGVIVPSGGFQFTTDSHATVSKSGMATLTCTYEKP